jgi:hypothetical protein
LWKKFPDFAHLHGIEAGFRALAREIGARRRPERIIAPQAKKSPLVKAGLNLFSREDRGDGSIMLPYNRPGKF